MIRQRVTHWCIINCRIDGNVHAVNIWQRYACSINCPVQFHGVGSQTIQIQYWSVDSKQFFKNWRWRGDDGWNFWNWFLNRFLWKFLRLLWKISIHQKTKRLKQVLIRILPPTLLLLFRAVFSRNKDWLLYSYYLTFVIGLKFEYQIVAREDNLEIKSEIQVASKRIRIEGGERSGMWEDDDERLLNCFQIWTTYHNCWLGSSSAKIIRNLNRSTFGFADQYRKLNTIVVVLQP